MLIYIERWRLIIRVKILKAVSVVAMASAIIPTNLFSYATSDISYVESVSAMVSIEASSVSSSNIDEDYQDNIIVTDIAEVLGIKTEDNDTYSLVFDDGITQFNTINTVDSELTDSFNGLTEAISTELNSMSVVEEETKEIVVETASNDKKPVEKPVITTVDQSEALIDIDSPDENYTGSIVTLTTNDRDLLEHLVMGEAGGQGMYGAALVAQAIRDTMVYKGYNSVADVRSGLKYSASINNSPNQDVLDAISFIFDQGGIAVKHKVYYFYAFKSSYSSWHESQHFVVEYGGHRFFSNK